NRTGVNYPAAAQTRGVKGNVTVQVTVDENGNVSDAHVVGGPEELRKSVLQSVLNWRFSRDEAKTKQRINVAFQPPPPGSAPRAKDPEIDRVASDYQQVIEQLKARLEAIQSTAALPEAQQRRQEVQQTQEFLQQRLAEAEERMAEARRQAENDAGIRAPE